MAESPTTVRITITTDAGTVSVECPITRRTLEGEIAFDATVLVQEIATLTIEQVPTLRTELVSHAEAEAEPWYTQLVARLLVRLRR